MTQAAEINSKQDTAPTVLIVDDHLLLTETLAAVLEKQQGFAVETATSLEEARAKIKQFGPYDAVLVDYEGPGMDGLNGLTEMIGINEGAVALFSGVANWSVVERAIEAGASGFIPKTLPVKTLGHAIRLIMDGDSYVPGDFTRRKSSPYASEFGLKPREIRVLALLCEGMPNKEIGNDMGTEESTVKMDVKSICRKMGVRNRTQAVIKAMRHNHD